MHFKTYPRTALPSSFINLYIILYLSQIPIKHIMSISQLLLLQYISTIIIQQSMQKKNSKTPKQAKLKSELLVTMMGISVSMIAFLSGYQLTCLSQLQPLIRLKNGYSVTNSNLYLTMATSSFFVGSLVGTIMIMLGPFVSKWFSDKFGERKAMIILDLVAVMTILSQLIHLSFMSLLLTRLVMGVVVGLNITILPTYLNSISPMQMRGRMGSLNQLLNGFGILSAYVYGLLVEEDMKDEVMWRIVLGFPVLVIGYHIMVMQLLFPFDCIQRHIANNQVIKVKEYCNLFYLNMQVDEMKQLKKKIIIKQKDYGFFEKIYKNRSLSIALLVIASFQLTGINGIFIYSRQLFNLLTNTTNTSQNLMLLLAITQIVGCFLNNFIVERYGRKQIFRIGQFSIIIILTLLYLLDRIKNITDNSIWADIQILFIFLHVIIFNLTLGPICMLYCSELVEDVTYVAFVFQLLLALISVSINQIIQNIGAGPMFIGFAILSLVTYATLINNKKMKETKGLSHGKIVQEQIKLDKDEGNSNYVFIGSEEQMPDSITLKNNDLLGIKQDKKQVEINVHSLEIQQLL